MERYFKIMEIDYCAFNSATGDDLDCIELIVPADGYVYVAIDYNQKDEMCIPLDCFDE